MRLTFQTFFRICFKKICTVKHSLMAFPQRLIICCRIVYPEKPQHDQAACNRPACGAPLKSAAEVGADASRLFLCDARISGKRYDD